MNLLQNYRCSNIFKNKTDKNPELTGIKWLKLFLRSENKQNKIPEV